MNQVMLSEFSGLRQYAKNVHMLVNSRYEPYFPLFMLNMSYPHTRIPTLVLIDNAINDPSFDRIDIDTITSITNMEFG